MSNLTAFNSVFERAMRVESSRKSFNESLTVNVPTQAILFAKSHIDTLEEQVQHSIKVNQALIDVAKKAGYVFDMDVINAFASMVKE